MVLAAISQDIQPFEREITEVQQNSKITIPTTVYSGSGGEVTPFFSTVFSGESKISKKRIDTNIELSKVIDYITSCFNLTMEELKTICKIQSRKTLYNWIDGISSPRPSTMERLYELFMISRAWKQSGFTNDRTQLHKPVLARRSVIDILKESTLNREQILFAGTRLTLLISSDQEILRDPFAK